MKSAMLLYWCVTALLISRFVDGQNSDPNPRSKMPACNVTGHWRSELGSLLWLSAAAPPHVSGVYRTNVELASGSSGPNREAKLSGVVSEGAQPTIAFTVLWLKGSCSTWVGQCFVLPGGGQVLKTLWLLRTVAESPFDNWESTRLGEDQFIYVREMESADGH